MEIKMGRKDESSLDTQQRFSLPIQLLYHPLIRPRSSSYIPLCAVVFVFLVHPPFCFVPEIHRIGVFGRAVLIAAPRRVQKCYLDCNLNSFFLLNNNVEINARLNNMLTNNE